MTTRTKSKNTLGTVQGWGIAQVTADGPELVATAMGRLAIRSLKRDVYPGREYKVVKINATLTHYTK